MSFRSSLSSVLCILLMTAGAAGAQGINAGDRQPEEKRPFNVREVATFDTPWAIAFLPDGRMLVTEKPGHIFLVAQNGRKTPVSNVPKVAASGQNGLLDIALSPQFTSNRQVYFTYVEPGDGGSGLALASATLAISGATASLDDQKVIWRQEPKGSGGQPGGIVTFSPDGKYLFLSSGDRMRPNTAQDPNLAMGKILRLNLDGSTPADNPNAKAGGAQAQTWSMGHRNPYGLAFAPDGKLWEHEMGPRGGDELNLIEPGKNYGWPVVSNGDNYNGTKIPRHSTRPEFAAPPLYWNPVIAPSGLVFYTGSLFPQWRGSALIGGLVATGLVRVAFDGRNGPDEVDRWDLDARIRDVAVAPDGAVWLIEDENPGRLFRLTPASTN